MSKSLSLLLTPNEERAVNSFVERLFDRYPDRIRQVVLFGSKARGDSGVWSDIDILIVVDTDDWRFQHAISTLAAGTRFGMSAVSVSGNIPRISFNTKQKPRCVCFRQIH